MSNRITKPLLLLAAFLTSATVCSTSMGGTQSIRVHYLGHAGFILQFDNGVGLVTDYAAFHDIGDFKPDIATFSHGHDDHAGGVLPNETHHMLSRSMALEVDGLSLKPIITSEASAGNNDNTSYLISYKDFKILHMGDAQGDISQIMEADEQAHLRQILPDKIDLLLMPIGSSGQRSISNQEVAAFIDFVHPRMVIPMHYWTFWGKRSFLKYMDRRNGVNGNKYKIAKVDGPEYAIDISRPRIPNTIEVISLEDSDF